jgi:hypothetical protein
MIAVSVFTGWRTLSPTTLVAGCCGLRMEHSGPRDDRRLLIVTAAPVVGWRRVPPRVSSGYGCGFSRDSQRCSRGSLNAREGVVD